ncbi:MAG TPA: YceI family protein [Mycobacterium sp.]
MTTAADLLSSAGEWQLDPDRSSFTFTNKTFWGLSSVKGRFTGCSGAGRVEPDGRVSGRVDVKATTVATGIKRRDNHLRSADFFDAEHFPDITVAVTGADPADSDELNVHADMSIRGNTIPLPMRVKAELLDDGAVRVTTTTTVERDQLGVSGNMIGMMPNTTTLSADAVFRRAAG